MTDRLARDPVEGDGIDWSGAHFRVIALHDRGFDRSEFKAFGVPAEESVERFQETVDIVLKAWTNEKLSFQGKYFAYDGVEVLPKPLQAPHPPVWLAASSTAAIERAAAGGFSILMDPHASRADLIAKRKLYGERLKAAGHSETGRAIPMARLIAIDETAEKARAVAERAAAWTVASYIGPTHGNIRQEPRSFGGKEPIAFYVDDVILHGTAESLVDQINALQEAAGMNYLLAAPLSRRSFDLLTDKVLPKVGG